MIVETDIGAPCLRKEVVGRMSYSSVRCGKLDKWSVLLDVRWLLIHGTSGMFPPLLLAMQEVSGSKLT
jgi:hypothetical protein